MNVFRRLLVEALRLAFAFLILVGSSAAQERTSYFHTIVVEQGAYKGGVTCVACGVIVKGDVEGDVVAVGGDVVIYGKVHNDVVASGGAVHLKNGSEVTRQIVTVGGPITYEGNVTVPGKEGYTALPWMHIPGQRSIGWRGALALFGFHVVCVLLAVAVLRPRRIRNVANASRRWRSTGLLGIAALPIFVLLFDWLDDKLANNADTFEEVGVILFTLVLAIGLTGVTLVLGERFFRGELFKALVAGTVLLAILELVPVAGFFVVVVVSFWAAGAALWSGLGFRTMHPPGKTQSSVELKLAG